MNEAEQGGRNAEGLALAQKLEGLVRRQQGTSNMNYAGVLHNEDMFLQNLGRYQEAVDKRRVGVLAGGIHRRGHADDRCFCGLA